MIHLFTGFDEREVVGWHVFVASVLERTTAPVAIHALDSRGLPQGSNAFTYSRFLVPWLMGFKGHAIYADASDMLMLADVSELDALFDPAFAVQCVQHQTYNTKHPIKYLGTSMQCPNLNYARKNWTSLMVVNCEHPYWRPLDPQTLAAVSALSVLQLGGLNLTKNPIEVGALPDKWNRLVDEGQSVEGAAIAHWTAGIPAFTHYRNAPGAELWRAQRDSMMKIS